jgi:hypothetical protein
VHGGKLADTDPWVEWCNSTDPDDDRCETLAGEDLFAYLDLVVDGCRLRPPRPEERGGEWDAIRGLGKGVRCRLAAGGWLRNTGWPPDVMARDAACILGREMDCDEFVDWYVDLATAIMDRTATRQMMVVGERARRDRIARQNGLGSFYAYRTAQARAKGYSSLWARRKVEWAT